MVVHCNVRKSALGAENLFMGLASASQYFSSASVAGDLNDMAYPSEKQGGVVFNYQRAALFNSRIIACSLMDHGFKGTPFTWTGDRRGWIIFKEQLDRALATEEWRLMFLETSVLYLPRIFSDHHPILINLQGSGGKV